MTQFKPMLAGKAPDDLSTLKFPLALSPKLDGIRALVKDGIVMSRSLKPIPNRHVQKLFGTLEGYDGELIVGSPTDVDCFRNTTSGVMTRDGEPDVYYHVFDHHNLSLPWKERFELLHKFDKVVIVPHYDIWSSDAIDGIEEDFLVQGYEGVMLRAFIGPYKNGRSTTREGWLLKLKRFEDSEALVLGMEEEMHNGNEATIGELGQTKRSSHQANLEPKDRMGKLIVRDIGSGPFNGVKFKIGSGFTAEQRRWWWDIYKHWPSGFTETILNDGSKSILLNGADLPIVNYSYQQIGSKDAPRIPICKGIRHKDDMS